MTLRRGLGELVSMTCGRASQRRQYSIRANLAGVLLVLGIVQFWVDLSTPLLFFDCTAPSLGPDTQRFLMSLDETLHTYNISIE